MRLPSHNMGAELVKVVYVFNPKLYGDGAFIDHVEQSTFDVGKKHHAKLAMAFGTHVEKFINNKLKRNKIKRVEQLQQLDGARYKIRIKHDERKWLAIIKVAVEVETKGLLRKTKEYSLGTGCVFKQDR